MVDSFVAAFVAIASALFVAELADKDAILILTLSTKVRARDVFLAGSSAFVITTAIIVTLGTFLVVFVPLFWVRIAGGSAMIGYGLWQARGLVGRKVTEEGRSKLENTRNGWKAFLGMVGALVLLDLAGDATEILTIVLVAQYSDALLVFAACCTGLIAATAFETALGNRLGRVLTPTRIRYASMVIFLLLGIYIIIPSIL